MKALRKLRTTGGSLVMAIKPHQSMRFNPAPDQRIEPDDCRFARGEPARFGQLEAVSSFFMKVGLR